MVIVIVHAVVAAIVAVFVVPMYVALLAACAYVGRVWAIRALFNRPICTQARTPREGEENNG